MDYMNWAEEYYRDADSLLPVIEKYKAKLKHSRGKNYEHLNSVIMNYRLIYFDLIRTGKTLEERGGVKCATSS